MRSLIFKVLIFGLALTPSFAFSDDVRRGEEGRSNEQRARMQDQADIDRDAKEEVKEVLTKADDVYKRVITDSEFSSRKELAKKAKCVAIFPNMVEAALVAGGRHSDGVVTCRNNSGEWSKVSFLDLVGGSLGAQIGGKSSDMVMLFMTEKAKNTLEQSNFTLGADVSYALGENDKDLGVTTEGRDIVAFSDSRGLFASAALSGTLIKPDVDNIEAYYGRDMQQRNLINAFDARPNEITSEVSTLTRTLL